MKMIVTTFDKARLRVGGMVLDRKITSGFPDREFKFWRYSSGWSAVTCRFRKIESMGSGADAQGRHTTFINDEAVRSDPCLVGARLDFDVDELFDQSLPFLLLPEASGQPASRRVKVRLHFSRLSDLPDVQGKDELSCDYAASLVEDDMPDLKERVRRQSSKLEAQSAVPPHSGLWLPFEIGSAQGAMQLGEQRGDDVFDAMLYLDRECEAIKPGSLLRRSVTWATLSGEHGSAEADVATVLE